MVTYGDVMVMVTGVWGVCVGWGYRLPTYLDIIKRPMDLGTVKTKLNNASYTNPDDFAAGSVTTLTRLSETVGLKDEAVS